MHIRPLSMLYKEHGIIKLKKRFKIKISVYFNSNIRFKCHYQKIYYFHQIYNLLKNT